MPETASPLIRVATPGDIPALVALESRYYVGNLPPESRDNGFLSIQHSAEWFAAAIETAGVHVADIAGDLVGVIAPV